MRSELTDEQKEAMGEDVQVEVEKEQKAEQNKKSIEKGRKRGKFIEFKAHLGLLGSFLFLFPLLSFDFLLFLFF